MSFVDSARHMYGSDFLVYNVHGLLHLADDIRRYGSLDSFSAFPFENELKSLKRLVRKASNPLAQCIRRLKEQSLHSNESSSIQTISEPVSGKHSLGPIPDMYRGASQYVKLSMGSFKLNISHFLIVV